MGSAIALGDFNNDGAPDVVLTDNIGITVLLNVRGTSASLSSSQNPSHVGQSVTFTAAVLPTVTGSAQIAGSITGTVAFYDGSMKLGSGTINQGRASFTTSSLASGSHTIAAKYSGSVNYNPASSALLVQIVNP